MHSEKQRVFSSSSTSKRFCVKLSQKKLKNLEVVIEDEDLVGGEAGEGSSTSHAEPDDEDSDKKEKEDLDDEATRQQDEDTTRLLILLQMAFGDQPCE